MGIRSRNICCAMGFLWSKVSESLEIFFKKKKSSKKLWNWRTLSLKKIRISFLLYKEDVNLIF